jgi:predicted dehydrogenase
MKYSRRQFISTISAGAALLALPSSSLFSNINFNKDEKKLGIALVGLGNYSTYQLAPALQETKYCYLAGVVTGTPEKADKWKKQYSIPDKNIYNYSNFDEISKNDSIDVIYVVLPNSMHHEFVLRAAKAGKHVICEKPMAVSVKESEEMIEVCKNTKVRLFVGYRLHSEPYARAAMNFRNKINNKIRLIESGFGFPIGDPAQWRLKRSLSGGGAIMDLGIYAIQSARYSVGKEPISVIAQEYKTDNIKFKEVDETVFWQMEFPDGELSNSTASYSSQVNRLYISAGRNWLELNPAFSYRGIKGNTNQGEIILPDINQQAAQMEDFSKCVLENIPSDADGEEGLKDMKVIEAIYRSIKTGKKVSV